MAQARPRARLIEAAVQVLATTGMRGLTHRKVEQRAEMAQGSVKYHFGTIDGLVEAVLRHMIDVESATVYHATPQEASEYSRTGVVPETLWAKARGAMAALESRPELSLARFELVLHAARHPELQGIVREARNALVREMAQAVAEADPAGRDAAHHEAGGRMLGALVDGILLHQLSAYEPFTQKMAPAMLLAGSGGALLLADGIPGGPPDEPSPGMS